MMKKLFSILVVVALFAMVGAPMVLASSHAPDNGLPQTGVPETGQELIDRIEFIGNWVFAIFLAISLIYIILGAFQFVTGAGDPEKISQARQKLIYAAVGIAIALLAGGFDNILRNILVG